jgi:hypothetical protein
MDIETLLQRERAVLNRHLPRERISLADALKAHEPFVVLGNGSRHYFDKNELKLLASLLPRTEHQLLKLPILIQLDPKLGRGAARISGVAETKVVGKLLNKQAAGDLILYGPEIALLRRKLSSVTDYAFLPG